MDHIAEEIDQANEAAVREDAPQPREFNEEENKAIIPIFKEDEQTDDEEERIPMRMSTQNGLLQNLPLLTMIFQILMSGKPLKTPIQMWFTIPTTKILSRRRLLKPDKKNRLWLNRLPRRNHRPLRKARPLKDPRCRL